MSTGIVYFLLEKIVKNYKFIIDRNSQNFNKICIYNFLFLAYKNCPYS